jgi:hypothetical protein
MTTRKSENEIRARAAPRARGLSRSVRSVRA